MVEFNLGIFTLNLHEKCCIINMKGSRKMEQLEGILLFILIYGLPLWISILCIIIYRTFIDRDSYARDITTGVIFSIGVRETLRWLRPRGRRR